MVCGGCAAADRGRSNPQNRHHRPVGVTAVRSYDDLVDSRLLSEDEDTCEVPPPAFVHHTHHPSGYVIDQVAQSAISLRRARVTEPGSPPKFGAQTREVLEELGLTEEEINAMIQSGAAREAWSTQYLPD